MTAQRPDRQPEATGGEFGLIRRHFLRAARAASPEIAPEVALGIGDDCALLVPPPGQQLAVSTDLLVEGRHFFAGTDPKRLGHKALAVNLSDLAACGARPLAFTLALALPRVDDPWLAAFARGLFALADAHGCTLVGGDTTAGPLTIGITVFGSVPPGQALLRSGARAGDVVWVSGTLGDARIALDALRGTLALPAGVLAAAQQRLEQPTPRVALGQALRGVATACADVSDGLLADLGHILAASGGLGCVLEAGSAIETIAARALWERLGGQFDLKNPLQYALAGGDDYELVFTAPPQAEAAVRAAAAAAGTPVTRIGRTTAEPGARIAQADGRTEPATGFAGWDHFAAELAEPSDAPPAAR